MKKTYVTTSIPYVNGEPHVGFALELVQADVIARYRRLQGSEVRLQTGADENAYKNVLSARREGLATADFVDRNSETFRRLGRVLGIGADDFLRTTEQLVYVWIDALINYLSGPGFGAGSDWRAWWSDEVYKVHVIGKNVWKFHAVYWPALLLSAGLPLPDEIVVHGFLTENGCKISKSRGRSVDPFVLSERFGAEALRYYLLRGVPSLNDGDFSEQRLQALYQADLANGLGNLVSRLTTLAERAGCKALVDRVVPSPPPEYERALEACNFDRAIGALWFEVSRLNREIEEKKPWEGLKRGEAISDLVDVWLRDLYGLAYWLSPFLPQTSEIIKKALTRKKLQAVRHLFPKIK